MKPWFILILLILLTVLSAEAEDYYWVGGTGYWSVLGNWRTADNQIPNEVPDPTDNVIFNENSFQYGWDTVYIQTGNPTCKNMTWENITDTVFLFGGINTVSFDIFGSVALDPKLRNKFSGKITFLSDDPGNTISCNGANFPGDLFFEGSGEWILQDNLIVLDTSDWQYAFFKSGISYGNSFMIQQLNGHLDLNGHTVICGTFVTGSSNPCELDLENGQVYLLNSWTLNGENLDFNGANSYIYARHSLSNFYGNEIHYNDIDMESPSAAINNTGVHTVIRKVRFLNGGSLAGYDGSGTGGNFTIDSLFFKGSHETFNNNFIASITGKGHTIHYTASDSLITRINTTNGTFHRIDIHGQYRGTLTEGIPDEIKGLDNIFDTLMIYNTPCKFAGRNTVTGLLCFKREAVISSIGNNKNIIHHAVFASNGNFNGNNDIEELTLGTGCQYRFRADSLSQPGSYHTNQYIQTIGQLEVSGNCNDGVTMLGSTYSPVQAVIDYTGGPLTTDYLQVQDIKNIGTLMTVTNGVDAGNNEGIQFIDPLQPRILYWVNGQGLWSDSDHWSLNSGGSGGECPPTRLDDIFFDSGSGFTATEDTVLVQSHHIHCNDMTWTDGFTDLVRFASADTAYEWNYDDTLQIWTLDTSLIRIDTCALHICGSIELDPMLIYGFGGDVYFESENDSDYETIDLEWLNNRYNLLNKAIFDGAGGKWTLADGTKFFNLEDSVIFRRGELVISDDTVNIYSFISPDTLTRKVTLSGKTLFVVRHWGTDGWNVNAAQDFAGNPTFEFDAGKSTIRSMGDVQNSSSLKGQCNIVTTGGPLTYHNIEFGFPLVPNGALSSLISESNCTYNCVDFYYRQGNTTGTGTIDTLTWHPTSSESLVADNYNINFVMAYGENDALYGNLQIDTALFYREANISGNHQIGYLRTDKSLDLDSMNMIDTALLLGDTRFAGRNVFSQLTLGANSRFFFENHESPVADTTIISDDFIVEGLCDGPIRLQSDIPGKQAEILYQAFNPSYPGHTADYVSIKDIRMIPWESNQYTALNSVDLGNNENWIFDQSGNETYYWIGGSGDWIDSQHWSYASGGPPISENCIPREINTVVFDNNSFEMYYDTVFVGNYSTYCYNMWWNFDTALYHPTFLGSDSSSLYVYGSMKLNYKLFYEFGGEVFFDQFNETASPPDTIYSRNAIFLNDVYLQGVDDAIVLDDPMYLSVANRCILHHLNGNFLLNGHGLSTGSFLSGRNTNRIIDMDNSTITVSYSPGKAFWLEGENLEFHSENATIINNSSGGSIGILNGDSFSFNDIIVNGGGDSLFNQNNSIFYRLVDMEGESNLVTGNFTADSVLISGANSGIYQHGTIGVVVVYGYKGSVNDFQQIDRCFFNNQGKIKGNNHVKYCVFNDDGTFLGQNTFDTLVLYPGQGGTGNQGNWFYFQIDSTQTVIDSLYIRGNQCSNMNISTTPLNSPVPAYIRKDNGFDVSADYLNIYNVGAVSGGNVAFYAGNNSTPLPNPDEPPPGWIFENAQGYIPGFNGRTEKFCTGDTCILDAGDFNGGPTTQYFWNDQPGDLLYPVTQPGTYYIKVVYNEGCEVNDFIVVEENAPPEAAIPGGSFCVGDFILTNVTPAGEDYIYLWWNGESTDSVEVLIPYSGSISVIVTDTVTTCQAIAQKNIEVKPVPDPESALGEDVTVKFGETITLDAGEGDYYEWTSDPYISIDHPDRRYITVPGVPDTVEYSVYVEMDGCSAEGTKSVAMFPPSRLGVPTAFSPNGDGLNDELELFGSGFAEVDLKIFNRYGQQVFETTDPQKTWDGKCNGIDQPEEVYTYYIRVLFLDQSLQEETGNISLLR